MTLPKLYLITDRTLCKNIFYTIEQALIAGVRMIQLREKDLSSAELYNMAYKMRELTNKYNAMLIINDRVDIALSVDADGIHVGKDSLSIPIIKNVLYRANKQLLIGYSAHSLKESIMVEDHGANWITFSPIYYTRSKMLYGRPQGIDRLIEITSRISIPVYALGGINNFNAVEVSKVAYGIALISQIIGSTDPKHSAEEMLDII